MTNEDISVVKMPKEVMNNRSSLMLGDPNHNQMKFRASAIENSDIYSDEGSSRFIHVDVLDSSQIIDKIVPVKHADFYKGSYTNERKT